MAASLIDGKAIANEMQNEMKTEVEDLSQKGVTPRLDVVLVGDDPASHVYVRNKERACERAGVISHTHRLPAETKQEDETNLGAPSERRDRSTKPDNTKEAAQDADDAFLDWILSP